jgi:hypothetical protein
MRGGWLPALALLGACDPDGAALHAGHAAAPAAVDGALALNTATLDGLDLRGLDLRGRPLAGVRLVGAVQDGAPLERLALDGAALVGVRAGRERRGAALAGLELHLAVADRRFTLRLDAVEPVGDLHHHRVSVRDDASGAWTSLCTDRDGRPGAALALRHTWDPATGDRVDDPDTLTFACRGAVLARCVESGYRPWAPRGADRHQACTRMVRADYCGDGSTHTLAHAPLLVYDRTRRADAPRWQAEAEWGPGGAVCVGPALRLDLFDDLGIAHPPPRCLGALPGARDCGSLPAHRPAELANAVCPGWSDDRDACS